MRLRGAHILRCSVMLLGVLVLAGVKEPTGEAATSHGHFSGFADACCLSEGRMRTRVQSPQIAGFSANEHSPNLRSGYPFESSVRDIEALGWHQEAHDAQHTGYTADTVPTPWTFKWQWNGSCGDPIGADCRPGDPELGWSFEIPPKSHLVAGNGRLYLPAGEQGVWAIDEANGKTAWHNDAITSFCTAAFDPETETLFVAGGDGQLYKLDSSTGAVLDSFRADSGLNLAPTVAAGNVYVVSDEGTLYAVDKHTMSLAWPSAYAAGSPGQTPVAYSEKQDVLIFGTADLYVHCVENSDGSRRWRVKPTVNENDGSSYDGGDKKYLAYNYEHGWPVVSEEQEIVFIRLRLPKSAMWQVPDSASWFPTSNAAIRAFLVARPELQTLFALNLSDGTSAFIPAVGTGGIETPDKDNTLGPLPVIRKLSDGEEVAYTIWRNGQKCEAGDCSDPRGDAVMCEMALGDAAVPGYQAGDCRFVQYHSSSDFLITDEMGKLTMAGDTLFHSHWLALYAYRITDRGELRGATYRDPILTEQRHPIINRASDEPSWVICEPNLGYFCPGSVDTYGDRRTFRSGFWVFFNHSDPPYEACTTFNCVAAYSDGYKARYAIVHDGTIYYELNGGTIFAVKSAIGLDAWRSYLPLVNRFK